ncbi:MAG: TolB protein, partial [Actinomycetota bacterium]|nr:TolB protein [Actinomycetota bacterium]
MSTATDLGENKNLIQAAAAVIVLLLVAGVGTVVLRSVDPPGPSLTGLPGRIVLSGTGAGNLEIYTLDADGSNLVRVTDNPAVDSYPAFSPDGSKIVFETNRDGNFEIYVMNADGSAPARLTTSGSTDFAPVWKPDGSKIAFHTLRDGNSEIY